MKKVLITILLVGIASLFIYVTYFLYSKNQSKPLVYKTEKAFVTNIIKKAVATGSVVPRQEIEIKPQVSGIIDKIFVEAGDSVVKGNLIARIKIIPNMVSLNNAENRLNQAKITVDNAQRDYDRNKKLYDQKVLAIADFQQTELALKSAKEEQDAAENNLQLIKEGVTKKAGQATNTLVRSTISGMVLDVPVEEGNSVIESNTFNDGTTIAAVADMSEMIFEGKVDESEVGKIKQGMMLIITIGAIEDAKFNATLEYISPKGVAEDGAIKFEIKAAMELKQDFFVRAGYSANADIVLDKRDNVVAINESLIRFEEDKAIVEVGTGPQQFEEKTIQTGLSDGINIEVVSGLQKGDSLKVQEDYGKIEKGGFGH